MQQNLCVLLMTMIVRMIFLSNSETIKIRYIDSPALEQKDGSDWIDTYIAEDVSMQPGEFKLISLGFACQLPDGYEAILAPRSSTFKRYGILQTNSIGEF